MRKEVILAIILGVFLGGVIIFGISLANKSVTNTTTTPSPAQISPEQKLDVATLQLTYPEDNDVIFQDTVLLTGKTIANAWVAIIWPEGESIIQANQSGNWEQEIELIGGQNIIEITSTNGAEFQESLQFSLIYTTANINMESIDTPTPTAQDEATPSAASTSGGDDQVDENLKQRIQEIVKEKLTVKKEDTLKGYAGSISQIIGLNLVVNISNNQMLQITTDANTNIIKEGKDTKLTSLSIDENIIIIGLLDSKDILSAKRIVAIKPVAPTTKRQTTIAPLSHLKVRNLMLGELEVTIPKNSDINTEEIQDGQTVIAIIETDLEDKTNTILSLQPLLQ